MKVFVTIILLIFPAHVFSQSCEQCKERNLIVYDNKVSVPAPDLNLPPQELIAKLGEWQDLFYLAGGVKNYVWNDPTSDCFRKFAAAFFTESDSINDRIKWGAEHADTPPDGPSRERSKGVDRLLSECRESFCKVRRQYSEFGILYI